MWIHIFGHRLVQPCYSPPSCFLFQTFICPGGFPLSVGDLQSTFYCEERRVPSWLDFRSDPITLEYIYSFEGTKQGLTFLFENP